MKIIFPVRQNPKTFTLGYMMHTIQTNLLQNAVRILLGVFMAGAAVAHCTFARAAFQAQVPGWMPLNKDLVVILSGIVEFALGISMIFWTKEKIPVGIALAIFYVLIFPGNIAQYTNHSSAFGLNTDRARLIRLFFQPILILLALWSTGVFSWFFNKG